VTTVPERSTVNRPVQATAGGALVQFGPFGSGLQRPAIRLQRLGWTDPNLHRILQEGSLESAYGSLANELLIGWDFSRHLKVSATRGTEMPGSGASARERAKVVREADADTVRRAPSSEGLASAAATIPEARWASGMVVSRAAGFVPLPPEPRSRSDRGWAGKAISWQHFRSRDVVARATNARAGPPSRPRLDKVAFSWKAPQKGRPRVAVGAPSPANHRGRSGEGLPPPP